jgi:DNA invertase Pin-like site-specific DNA recombinase
LIFGVVGLGVQLVGDSRAGALSVSTLLAAIAEFERELIRERTGAGRERAKARGTKFGPKFKLNAHQRAEALRRLDAGEVGTDVARSYGVHESIISRLRMAVKGRAAFGQCGCRITSLAMKQV